MSEHDTIEKVKNKQGILSKIQNFFTLGYGTKEDLRELDKKLRDLYYEDLRDLRHVWEDLYLEVLEGNISDEKRNFKKVIQVMDRVIEKIRRADYGYAGLFDRKGHIRETELARIYNYEKELNSDIETLKEAVSATRSEVEAENWANVSKEVKKIKNLILNFEDKMHDREKKFRPLEI